jgi:hypothetical protein
MATKTTDKKLTCTHCRRGFSVNSLWLDDTGPMCKDCVMIHHCELAARHGPVEENLETVNDRWVEGHPEHFVG